MAVSYKRLWNMFLMKWIVRKANDFTEVEVNSYGKNDGYKR